MTYNFFSLFILKPTCYSGFTFLGKVEMKIKDLETHEAGSYIKNLDDVKDYLECVIQEDETLDDVKYSIEILSTVLERLTK